MQNRWIIAVLACALTLPLWPTPLWTAPAFADAGEEAYNRGDYATAREVWQKTAFNDPYAAYNLGVLFETGQGGDKDYKQAFKWYDKAGDDARRMDNYTLYRQAVLMKTRIVIKNRDHDILADAAASISTLAMTTGDPEALRLRGLLMEFQADYSIENNIRNADNPMRMAWGLLRVAADRGSKPAKAEASRVWAKIDNKKKARESAAKLIKDELKRNGVR